MTGKLTLTPPEAAALSGFNIRTITAAMNSDELVAHWKPPANRNRFILRADLERYIESRPLA